MTVLLERIDLTIQELQLWLQTDTAVLSYGREKKGTQSNCQSNCQTLETLPRVQLGPNIDRVAGRVVKIA